MTDTPETDVRLTQAEKDALWDATDRAYVDTTTWDHEVESEVERTVERIVAERVRVVEGERDRLRRWKDEALPVIDGLQDLGDALGLPLGERITGPAAVEAARNLTARAESAEAAHEALRAGVEALADEWEGWSKQRSTTRIDAFRDAAESLRALLAGDAS